ncbi:hypothetical protein IFR04_014383 [Cadophora malorum]|uniref:ferric-chelate reductase (NADPH) n=1 Tax=Cadophora malorum TaxID=108018 RepID=A0A8H7SZM8_9HELO|nr:hypothetical protein IFR04_014383 [Cadophora malorum]
MSFSSFVRSGVSKLSDMDIPSWYCFILGCTFAIWLLLRAVYRAFTSEWLSTSSFFLKHVAYPHVFPRIPFLGTATRLEVLLASAYLVANIVLVTVVGVDSRSDIGTRAAIMSTINLIPLLCGPRLSLMTEMLGITLRASIGSHQWLGRTAVAEVLLHTIISLTGSHSFEWTGINASGVVASSALGLLLLFSFRVGRRLFYEWFLNLHLFLTVTALIAIGRHVFSKKPAEIFLQIGICFWVGMTTLHWLLFAFRNFAIGRPFAKAVATRLSIPYPSDRSLTGPSNVLQVDITVPRKWKVRAGQYVFVSIPKLGILVGLRGHPFMISWWDWSQKGLTISLLVKSRTGFTGQLDRYTNTELLAFIDGPYGIQHKFGEYGTVIMFATGIGIAGHIPYIKDLISGYNNCQVRTRRILLVWQINNESQEQWVKSWMDDLLDSDTGYILEVRLHVLDHGGKKDLEYGNHSKIKKIFNPPNIVEVLQTEFASHRGKVMVSQCADRVMADKVRREVQRRMNKRVHLVELDFQPSLRETGWPSTSDMEFKCKG